MNISLPPVLPIRPLDHSNRRAFSLVEVVLALGIASFSLVVMMGVFGSVIKVRGENINRKEAFRAASALQGQLTGPGSFPVVYDWVRGGEKELVYARYKADASGAPSASGARYRSEWLEPTAVTSGMEGALDGRWVKAKLSWDDRDHVNSMERDELPSDINLYPDARATLRAELHAVPSPTFTITDGARPAITTSVTLNR